MELLDFCYEILMRILEEVDPADLAACSQTSSAFRSFIKDNRHLFKTHYLRHYDDPRQHKPDDDPDWVLGVQNMVKCMKITSSEDTAVKRKNLDFIMSSVEHLVQTGLDTGEASLNKVQLTNMISGPRNLEALVYRSSLYRLGGTAKQEAAENDRDRQSAAKLHCLHGIASGALGRKSLSIHPYARSKVYDLRNYNDQTHWGPFHDDGSMRVDWEMLEAIMIVITYNCETSCPRFMPQFKLAWTEPFWGILKHVARAQYPPTLPLEPDIPLHLKDPYNVTGYWNRVVCFLDYHDLYTFNFGASQPEHDEPRQPIRTQEVIRYILMKFEVSSVEPPGQFDNQRLPVTHFTGISRSMDVSWDPNANSRIRGTVRLTPEGEVRWTTISIFHGGEERWRSEGIQVGGVNSKRGVTGTWFDKDYDPHGPAGPTAFWKIATEEADSISDIEDEDSEDDLDFILVTG